MKISHLFSLLIKSNKIYKKIENSDPQWKALSTKPIFFKGFFIKMRGKRKMKMKMRMTIQK